MLSSMASAPQSTVTIGFAECLPSLASFLERRFRVQSTPSFLFPHAEHHARGSLSLAPWVLDQVSSRNRLDNLLHRWATIAFPAAACSEGASGRAENESKREKNPRSVSVSPVTPNDCDEAPSSLIITHHKSGTWMVRASVEKMNTMISVLNAQRSLGGKCMLPALEQPPVRPHEKVVYRPCAAQVRRHPMEMVVSAYLYHRAAAEPWTTLPLETSREAAEVGDLQRQAPRYI